MLLRGAQGALTLGGGSSSSGYALCLESNGQSGSTTACETFASPALVEPPASSSSPAGGRHQSGQVVRFEIAAVELILLTGVPCTF